MSRIDILAAAIRLLSTKSNVIGKPDAFAESINTLFGFETYDVRLARSVDADLTRAADAIKTARTNRKFKKLTKNI